jgi:peptide/nickel transport system substrate-binding protein
MQRDVNCQEVANPARRRVLRRFGQAGAVGLLSGFAGCGALDSGADSEGDGEETSGDPVDPVFNTPTPRVPADMHWNLYNPSNLAGPTKNWVLEFMLGFRQGDATFVPSPLFDELSIEGTTMTITVTEGVTWHDGDPITASDVVTQVKMDIFMQQPPGDVIETAQALNEREVEIDLKTENREIVLGTYAGRYFHASENQYGEFVTQFENAGSESERESIREEVASFEAEENGAGPFTITEATAQKFTGEVHDGHPASEALQGVTFEATKTTGNQGILQMGISGKTDYIGPIVLSESDLAQLPDHFQINPTSNLSGFGLFWNHTNEHIARPEFRRAIAYLADREQMAKDAAGLKFKAPVGVPTGISGVRKGIPERWVGDALSEFTAYERSTDRAAQLLESAGYTKQDGEWVGPNGSPVSLRIVLPGGWTDWVPPGETLGSQLDNFGIQTDVEIVDAPTWNGETVPNGDFDITPRFWGGGRPHPFFGFRTLTASSDAAAANLPTSVEVPMPVGDPDGTTTDVDIEAKTQQIPETSGAEAEQLVRELAWAVNQSLPVLPIMEKVGAVWWSTDGWEVPSADNKWMTVTPPKHLAWPLHEGEITPERE